MAAKKKALAAPSVCELGGPEIQVMGIRVRASDVVDFSAFACGTSAQIDAVIFDQAGTPMQVVSQQGVSSVTATLPRLAPGHYTLVWSFIMASTPWQTRAEVAVNAVDRFRQRKDSATSTLPFLRSFLLLEVVP